MYVVLTYFKNYNLGFECPHCHDIHTEIVKISISSKLESMTHRHIHNSDLIIVLSFLKTGKFAAMGHCFR
jgi:hypothetical protein